MGNNLPTLIDRMRQFLRAPVNQKERIKAGTAALISLGTTASLLLLRWASGAPVISVLVALGLGVLSAALLYKYPEKRGPGIICGVVAGIVFLTAIPGLKIVAGAAILLGIFCSGALALWKTGSIIYSVFSRKR